MATPRDAPGEDDNVAVVDDNRETFATTARRLRHEMTPYLAFVVAVASLGTLQYGYHLAELNAPERVIRCSDKSSISGAALYARIGQPSGVVGEESISSTCFPMDEVVFASVSSMFTAGGLCGALIGGYLASTFGRKWNLVGLAFLYLVGSLIEATAIHWGMLMAGRFVAGWAAGMATVIAPIYISEVAPPRDKGLFGFMTQISINIGILLTQTLGHFMSYPKGWRNVFYTGVAVAALNVVTAPFLVESPIWCRSHGKLYTAFAKLRKLRGANVDVGPEMEAWKRPGDSAESNEHEPLIGADEAVSNTDAETANGAADTSKTMSFLQVAVDSHTRPAIIAVIGIMCAQQLCGINAIIMYSVSLLANVLPIDSGVVTIIVSVVNLVATLLCAPLPDRVGRKTCLLVSIAGQGISSLVLAIALVAGQKVVSVIAVMFFVASFAVGLGPVPFMMASEMVKEDAVGATQSWSLGSNYVATFAVAQCFPIVNKALNERFHGTGYAFFVFAALALCSFAFVTYFVPETLHKADADEVWGRRKSSRAVR